VGLDEVGVRAVDAPAVAGLLYCATKEAGPMPTTTRAPKAVARTISPLLLLLLVSPFAISAGELLAFDTDNLPYKYVRLVAQRLHDETSGRTASIESQKRRAAALDPQVDALLDAQEAYSADADVPLDGAFAEVKREDDQDIDFARGYFDPIRVLARAYALPGSRHYHSDTVAEALRRAFTFTRRRVYPGCDKPGNWWVWAKQMPDCLCDVLALLADDVHPDDKVYLVSILDYLVGSGPIQDAGYHHGKSGKDALNALKVGVLSGDRPRIAHAWEGIENKVGPYLLEPDGTPFMTVIREDFLGVSLPYVYEGYNTVVEWVRLTNGTAMALRDQTIGRIVQYLLDLGRWNTIYDTEVAWIGFTSYRVFWRPATTLSLAAQLGAYEVPRAAELKAMAARTDTPPDGVRYWPNAETLIFRSPGLYCGLVMASQNRHPISACYKNHFLHIGNQWYYGRDGHLVLVTRPEDAHPNLTYTLDWRRLTGVTRDDGSVLDSDQLVKEDHGYWQPGYLRCKNPLAGAATVNDRDAVAGIVIHSGGLRARKSYFLIHARPDGPKSDLVLALGDRIQGRGQTDTIVHTFPVGDRPVQLAVNGQPVILADDQTQTISTPAWIHGPAAAYYFPEPGAVTLLTETRQPDFTDHGDPPPDQQPDVPPQRYVTIYFDHGEAPEAAAYACAYFPQAALDDMPELIEDFKQHAAYARDPAGHSLEYGPYLGLAFFKPGPLDGYTADRPCFLAAHQAGDNLRLAVYGPSFKDVPVNLELPRPATAHALPRHCELNGATLTVHAPRAAQATVDLAFAR